MSLKGNLRHFSITQLLNLINLAGRSGKLTIQGEIWAEVSFLRRNLIHALMEDGVTDLAQILWQNGKLSEKQMRTIEAHSRDMSEKQIARLLVRAGHVTAKEIHRVMRQHVSDIVSELFTWSEGTFTFEDHQLPSPELITVAIDLESVIMEGERYRQEWAVLQKELPDLNVYLRCPSRPHAYLPAVQLTLKEWRVIAASNARNTISQIARANKIGAYQIRRIVYGLLSIGLVEIVPPPQPVPIPAANPL